MFAEQLFYMNKSAQLRQKARKEWIKFDPYLTSNYSQMSFDFLLGTRRKTEV